VSAATLEDEIKSIQRRIATAIENEGDFRAQGHRQLRPHLATAAIVFAVINQFDEPVRWQADSGTARDRFVRATQNARAGSAQVLRQVAERAQDLEDLIRGGRLTGPASAAPLIWPELADRQLMMQRLEVGWKTTLEPGVASPASVEQHQAALVHESEMTALLATVLKQPDMPDSADDEYRQWCERLERAALELREAAQKNDPAAARQAFDDAQSQCAACHEVYR
jgi:cytochrome c556